MPVQISTPQSTYTTDKDLNVAKPTTMTMEDLNLDLKTFMAKAVDHISTLQADNIEEILRTYTIIANRMSTERENESLRLGGDERVRELQLLWCMMGTMTGTTYRVLAKFYELECRLTLLEKERDDAEDPDSSRTH